MKYTIGTAAKAVGRAKSTLSREVKEGKISADKLEDGSYSIDASELIRVYGEAFDPNRSENPQSNDSQPEENPNGTGALQAVIEQLHERLSVADLERDRERRQLTDQVEDLRRRLDEEGEERRKLTAILTDQRATKPDPAQEPAPQPLQAPPQQQQPEGGFWGRVRYLTTGKS